MSGCSASSTAQAALACTASSRWARVKCDTDRGLFIFSHLLAVVAASFAELTFCYSHKIGKNPGVPIEDWAHVLNSKLKYNGTVQAQHVGSPCQTDNNNLLENKQTEINYVEEINV
jgi:hypothetical protein